MYDYDNQYVRSSSYSRFPGEQNLTSSEKGWAPDGKNPQTLDTFPADPKKKTPGGAVFVDYAGKDLKKSFLEKQRDDLPDGYVLGEVQEFETVLVCDGKVKKFWKWCNIVEYTIRDGHFGAPKNVGDCDPKAIDPSIGDNTELLKREIEK